MDSFATVTIPSAASTETESSVPISYEEGSTSFTFCVISRCSETDAVPTDEEQSTGFTYCVVA
ncbi:hypothetical protein DFH11DRAFT_1501540 [Phellopilus nigrolimitatus]|nr:hypothetical protein DFH11DRAFT_1501540 [Phellopilus nigrolimitatus]